MSTKALLQLSAAVLSVCVSPIHAADTFLAEDGHPRVAIVISDKPQLSTRSAAQELQNGIQKISSARLPIVTQPTSAPLEA